MSITNPVVLMLRVVNDESMSSSSSMSNSTTSMQLRSARVVRPDVARRSVPVCVSSEPAVEAAIGNVVQVPPIVNPDSYALSAHTTVTTVTNYRIRKDGHIHIVTETVVSTYTTQDLGIDPHPEDSMYRDEVVRARVIEKSLSDLTIKEAYYPFGSNFPDYRPSFNRAIIHAAAGTESDVITDPNIFRTFEDELMNFQDKARVDLRVSCYNSEEFIVYLCVKLRISTMKTALYKEFALHRANLNRYTELICNSNFPICPEFLMLEDFEQRHSDSDNDLALQPRTGGHKRNTMSPSKCDDDEVADSANSSSNTSVRYTRSRTKEANVLLPQSSANVITVCLSAVADAVEGHSTFIMDSGAHIHMAKASVPLENLRADPVTVQGFDNSIKRIDMRGDINVLESVCQADNFNLSHNIVSVGLMSDQDLTIV